MSIVVTDSSTVDDYCLLKWSTGLPDWNSLLSTPTTSLPLMDDLDNMGNLIFQPLLFMTSVLLRVSSTIAGF